MFARAVWSATLGCAVLVCAVGVVVVPVAVLAGLASAIVVVLSFVSLCVRDVVWVERHFGPHHATARAMAVLALVLGVTGLLTATLAELAGPAPAFAGTGLILATGAWSGWRVRTVPPSPGRRAEPAKTVRCPGPAAVTSLSVDELCLAWRRSFVLLQRARDEQTRHALVAARQAYLDELERRDRRGFVKWLDSGARAAGDPSRFVGRAE